MTPAEPLSWEQMAASTPWSGSYRAQAPQSATVTASNHAPASIQPEVMRRSSEGEDNPPAALSEDGWYR